jgi:hypothetical protein
MRAFCEADAVWIGHISIVTLDGIQMVEAGRR